MPDLAAAMGQILPEIINRHEGSDRVVEWYLRNYYQKSAFLKSFFCYVRLFWGSTFFPQIDPSACRYLLTFDLGAIARPRGNRLNPGGIHQPLRRNRHLLLPTGGVIPVPDPQQPSQLTNPVASFPQRAEVRPEVTLALSLGVSPSA